MAKSSAPDSSSSDLDQYRVKSDSEGTIYSEGEVSDTLFFVERGTIELSTGGASEHRVLAQLGLGDFFGESCLVEKHPRDHTARALGAHTLLRLDRPAFDRIVAERPEVATKMLATMVTRERAHRAAAAAAADAFPPAETPTEVAPPRRSERAILRHLPSSTEFPLAAPAAVMLGRPDSKGFTPDVDLSPFDTQQKTLSRRHASVFWRDGAFLLREESATKNGTFVNNSRLTPSQEVELNDGDRIRCGLVDLVFRYE